MSSRKKASQHKKPKGAHAKPGTVQSEHIAADAAAGKVLEIVLKCDTSGCLEAVAAGVDSLNLPEIEISIISSGVGAVNKSDVFMAETGSRLIVGFNVGLAPHIDRLTAEHNVEIRLYEVIYKLLEDLESIAKTFVAPEPAEKIIGSARVIALFKSSRKGVILGCEVLTGMLAVGHSFRILGAMGPIYAGRIESLHIEKDAVRQATRGQQVGLKIRDFNKAKIGDLVESYQPVHGGQAGPWKPQGRVYYPQA